MLSLRSLTDADIVHVLGNLNPEDQQEIVASQVADALAMFRAGAESAVLCGCVACGEEAAAIFGLDMLDGIGVPWMVATPEFRAHPRDAMRLSREVITQMRANAPRMHNVVFAEHEVAICWLTWLGFTVDRTRRVGPNDDFFYFSWSTDV